MTTCHPPFSAVGTEAEGGGAGSAAETGNTKATANERAVRRNAMKEKIGWAAKRKNQRIFFMGRCLKPLGRLVQIGSAFYQRAQVMGEP